VTLGRWQRVAGDAVLGTGGNILGIALDATGVGAVVGVLATVVSTPLTVDGTAVMAMGKGLYTDTHERGRTYSGKGDQARSQASGSALRRGRAIRGTSSDTATPSKL
jgi:hypothetical protein